MFNTKNHNIYFTSELSVFLVLLDGPNGECITSSNEE